MKNRIYDYMRLFGSITTFQAFTDLGCTRLSEYIRQIRLEHIVKDEWVTTTDNNFSAGAKYFYIDTSKNQVRSSFDDYVSRSDYLVYAGTSTAVKPSDPIRASVEYEWRYFDPDNL